MPLQFPSEEKESTLDKIIKGLNAANQVFGIGGNIASIEKTLREGAQQRRLDDPSSKESEAYRSGISQALKVAETADTQGRYKGELAKASEFLSRTDEEGKPAVSFKEAEAYYSPIKEQIGNIVRQESSLTNALKQGQALDELRKKSDPNSSESHLTRSSLTDTLKVLKESVKNENVIKRIDSTLSEINHIDPKTGRYARSGIEAEFLANNLKKIVSEGIPIEQKDLDRKTQVEQKEIDRKLKEKYLNEVKEAKKSVLRIDEKKAALYAGEAEQAEKEVQRLEAEGFNPTSAWQYPFHKNWVPNPTIPEKIQRYLQAKQQFVLAGIRLKTGAAIKTGEFDEEADRFFPKPGDKPGVVEQKKRARQLELGLLKRLAGSAAKEPIPGQTSTDMVPMINPQGIPMQVPKENVEKALKRGWKRQ